MPRAMRIRRFVVLGVLIGLFQTSGAVLAAPPTADENSIEDVIRKIQAAYEKTIDWKAGFQQITRIEGFDAPITSRGRLYIKKPDKLRWDYSEPNRHQIVVNAQKIWIYTPEQNQVIVSPFADVSDSQLPLHLLSGVGRLDQDFTVQWADPEKPQPPGAPALILIPKDPRTGLTRLRMEVDPGSYFITRLALFEANGNESSFQFTQIGHDTGLKDRFFVFTPPKGVVVVEAPRMRP